MPAPSATTTLTAADFPKLSSLPIINIAPYLTPGNRAGRISTSAALHAACLEYGFFYLDISSYVDPSEPEELTRLAREFFALPVEEKEKIALRHQDRARGKHLRLLFSFSNIKVFDPSLCRLGYARLKENVTNGKADNHEGIDFYRPVDNPDKTKPLWGENQWPDIPGFKDKYDQWVEKMKKLGIIVMQAYVFCLSVITLLS